MTEGFPAGGNPVAGPGSPAELLQQAFASHRAGNLEEAAGCYRRVLGVQPGEYQALYWLGVLEFQRGRYQDADHFIGRALEADPRSVEAYASRALVLKAARRPEAALACYDQALAVEPGRVDLLTYRAGILRNLGRCREALEDCDRALEIDPRNVAALNGRALNLIQLRRAKEGLACLEKAHAIKPDDATVLNNYGQALRNLARFEEAAQVFERLLEIAPESDYALGALMQARLMCCDWRSMQSAARRLSIDFRAQKRRITPFSLLAISGSPQDQLLASRIWVRDHCPASPDPVWKGERYRHDRIRLAYLSADFHDHATAQLMAGLFEIHDRRRFDITAISFGPDPANEMRARLKAGFERFLDVAAKSDIDVARSLRAMEIDIAVDLKGFTAHSRPGIFALRPAPIQASYLGYPATMGADYMDYLIADRAVVPEADRHYYTEKIVYLPDSYQVNDSLRRISDRTFTRAETDLPEAGFVFCCFNSSYKITPRVFDVWMRLLRSVEGSVLWLLPYNAATMRNLRREAVARGIAAERLVFAPRLDPADHLARHRLADLFLDTLPYNAHTTASDALWAGLPVLTCLGNAFAGRVAASLLQAVGLPELITRSLEEYESLALTLASDRARLSSLRTRLAENRRTHPLFDTDRFRHHIEAAYVTMWERHARGDPPVGFAVAPLRVDSASPST